MSDHPTRPIRTASNAAGPRGAADRTEGDTETAAETAAGNGAPPAPVAGLEPGTRFDRFQVITQLGAGGMGVVVSAFDPDLDRKVAIKVLRAGGFGTSAAEARARMMTEAKAMARLAHPNVVTVHEVGTVADDVFIVMELVEGETLGTWLETRRPWREVVEVMTAAGRGLAAAHAAGLVHRDFKPHNILLGRDGRVRVTDFGVVGVAGAGGGDLLIGTPAYMAPEQHEQGIIDARADQYGFCVSLHEALYGVRPYDGDSPEELRMAVLAGSMRTPPDDRDVPSRLHDAVVRGLARDPAERFPSMEALLAELAHDPARRRRRVAQLVGVAGLTGAAVFAWTRATSQPATAPVGVCGDEARSLDGVWDGDVAARMRGTFVRVRPALGEDTYTRAATRLDDYARRWASAHDATCATRRTAADVAFLGRVTCLAQLRDQLRELTTVFRGATSGGVIDGAVTAVASLVPPETCAAAPIEPADDPAVRAVRARLDRAEALWRTGLWREAKQVAEALSADAARLPYPRLEAEAFLVLAGAHERLNEGPAAITALERAARAAAAADADDLVARAYTELLWVTAYVESRSRDALTMQPFAEAAVIRAGDPPTLRARLWFAIAAALVEQGRYDDAVPYLERARNVWLRELDPQHPDAARPLISLGNVASYRGRIDQAVDYYQQALVVREAALGANHPDLAGVLVNLGGIHNQRGDYDGAVTHCQRSLDISVAAFGASSPTRPTGLRCLAQAAQGKGDLGRARALLEESLGLVEDTPEGTHYYYLTAALADVLSDQGEHARALALCDRAFAYFSSQVPPEHPDLAFSLTCRGRALVDLGRAAQAVEPLERALILRAKGAGPDELATTRFALARALVKRDRTRAVTLATQAGDGFAHSRSARRLAAVQAFLAELAGRP